MRVVAHHCQHICCGAAREASMRLLWRLTCVSYGVGSASGIAGVDRLDFRERNKENPFTARTRFSDSTLPLSTAIRRRVGHGRAAS